MKCPRCLEVFEKLWSLSRRDNETYICSECGQAEAFEDIGMINKWSKKPYWNTEETP